MTPQILKQFRIKDADDLEIDQYEEIIYDKYDKKITYEESDFINNVFV